jgi:hypothetical protein
VTEEACMAVDRLYEGNNVECSTYAYHSEIRNAIILFALDCAYSNDANRMQIALAEVNRLDNEHCYGMSDSVDPSVLQSLVA